MIAEALLEAAVEAWGAAPSLASSGKYLGRSRKSSCSIF